MNDLQTAVHSSLANLVASGAVEKMIEEQLAATIQSIIKSSMREYSDFGKQVEGAVKKALHVNFDQLGLPGYNDFILKVIRSNVEASMEKSINSQVVATMAELLGEPPTEIKFSELLKEFIEHNKEEDGSTYGEHITLLMEKKYDWTWISIDKDADTKEYSCDFRFAVDGDGKIHGMRFGDKELQKTLFVGSLHGFEKKLFQLYAAGTKLVLDHGSDAYDYETEYPESY